MDQVSAMMCHAAGCTEHADTSFNQLQPQCGSQTVCQMCPTPGVSQADICSLTPTFPGQINLIEGVVLTSHVKTSNSNVEYIGREAPDEITDEENSFLQIDAIEMQFSPATSDKEVISNSLLCAIDPNGFVDISVRIAVQWYKVPGSKISESAAEDVPDDENDMLEITGFLDDSVDDGFTPRVPYPGPSFLQLFPNIMGKVKKIFNLTDNIEHYEEKLDDIHQRGTKLNRLYTKSKTLYTMAKLKFGKPRFHVHFSVTDQTITHCRQTQRWYGDLTDKSLLYTAVQNVRLKPSQLRRDFFRNAIKLHVTCKGCELLDFRSCVHAFCPKKPPMTRSLSMPSLSLSRTSGIMQPSMPLPAPAFLGASTPPLPTPQGLPRPVFTPEAVVTKFVHHQPGSSVALFPEVTLAALALALCVIDF